MMKEVLVGGSVAILLAVVLYRPCRWLIFRYSKADTFRLASQGDPDAQNIVGEYYDVMRRDYRRAVEWCQRSADQRHADGLRNLGYCYEKGRGVPIDHSKARDLYLKSYEQGNAKAAYYLFFIYYQGLGAPPNEAKALEYLRESAKRGYQPAQTQLKRLGAAV